MPYELAASLNWKSNGFIGVSPLAVTLNARGRGLPIRAERHKKPPLKPGPWIVLPRGDQLAFPALPIRPKRFPDLLKLADESGDQDCIDQIKEKGRHQRNNQKRLPRCSVLLRHRRHVCHGRWC